MNSKHYHRREKSEVIRNYLVNKSDTRRNHNTPQARFVKGRLTDISDRPADTINLFKMA
jgi:hypothetical protein